MTGREAFVIFSNALPEPMMLVSASGAILASNPAARQLLNLRTEYVLLTELALADSGKFSGYLQSCLRSGELMFGSFSFATPQPVRCRCEGARFANDGNPAVLLRVQPHSKTVRRFLALNDKNAALAKEIMERRHAEEQVRSLNAQFHAVIQASPVGILMFDLDRTVRLINPAAERIFGWSAQELVGKMLPLPRRERPKWKALLNKLLTGEAFVNVEVRRSRKDAPSLTHPFPRLPYAIRTGSSPGSSVSSPTSLSKNRRKLHYCETRNW